MTIPERLAAVRQQILAHGWSAFVDIGTDPHDSEYMAPHWETRSWLTGFTGSAGTVAVTKDKAGLWTDGRYFLQAESELQGSGIDLFREGMPGTPSMMSWLASVLPSGAAVGVDGRTVPWAKLLKWRAETAVAGLKIQAGPDLLGQVWTDRPSLPARLVEDYEAAVGGLESRTTKIERLRKALGALGAGALAVTALDDLAWLLNLRGSDIDFTPVFLGWGWIDAERAVLFTQEGTLSPALQETLAKAGVTWAPYERFEALSREFSRGAKVLVPDRTNASLVQAWQASGAQLVETASPLTLMKAKKSEAELALIRRAHEKDGAALVEFLAWLRNVPEGTLTETGAAHALDDFRSRQGGWRGPSFTAIPGFREHGAVIHYHAPGEGARLAGRGLFLLDTGAQYVEGTTDVTRTLVFGTPTAEEIEDYTLVLKAHVQVSLMPFPVGTRGYMIDALARRVLWKEGRNYNHGTGHGVGSFLSVHEASARLNTEPLPTALEPGMLLSNEPGLYRPGKYGIRIENLVTVAAAGQTEFAAFLGWQTLTLCPYERRLIDASRLDADERAWIDSYHAWVLEKIGPLVSEPARKWLEEACQPL